MWLSYAPELLPGSLGWKLVDTVGQQPPSTVIVRKIGPRIHMSLITLLWGAVMLGMGFVKDWGAMAGLRVLLGVLEAGALTVPTC